MTIDERDNSVKTLEDKISKFRGSECKIKISDGIFEVTGSYSYFPEGCSVGTATTVEDSILVAVQYVENLFLHELIGRLANCGLANYDDRKTIERLLTEEVTELKQL